jgi:nitroimidazol reductase NimA-like FMN-containing flavoprotein (pyridoxamine 5'-phosphate oxidase superfamily)
MDKIREKINNFITNKSICVLATVEGDRPYCSLMNYFADDSSSKFYMVTLRNTRKFQNLLSNPWVSLLIDSGDNADLSSAQALTVEGVYESISDQQKIKWAKSRLSAENPPLEEFCNLPDTEVLCIRARSFLFLNGLLDSHYLVID